jgi:hypothetical protein
MILKFLFLYVDNTNPPVYLTTIEHSVHVVYIWSTVVKTRSEQNCSVRTAGHKRCQTISCDCAYREQQHESTSPFPFQPHCGTIPHNSFNLAQNSGSSFLNPRNVTIHRDRPSQPHFSQVSFAATFTSTIPDYNHSDFKLQATQKFETMPINTPRNAANISRRKAYPGIFIQCSE